MSDTNRNLTAKTLLLLGELAKAMGAAFESVGRPLFSTSIANLSDNKSQVCHASDQPCCTHQQQAKNGIASPLTAPGPLQYMHTTYKHDQKKAICYAQPLTCC